MYQTKYYYLVCQFATVCRFRFNIYIYKHLLISIFVVTEIDIGKPINLFLDAREGDSTYYHRVILHPEGNITEWLITYACNFNIRN